MAVEYALTDISYLENHMKDIADSIRIKHNRPNDLLRFEEFPNAIKNIPQNLNLTVKTLTLTGTGVYKENNNPPGGGGTTTSIENTNNPIEPPEERAYDANIIQAKYSGKINLSNILSLEIGVYNPTDRNKLKNKELVYAYLLPVQGTADNFILTRKVTGLASTNQIEYIPPEIRQCYTLTPTYIDQNNSIYEIKIMTGKNTTVPVSREVNYRIQIQYIEKENKV